MFSLLNTLVLQPSLEMWSRDNEKLIDEILLTIFHLYVLIGKRAVQRFQSPNIIVDYKRVRCLENKAFWHIFRISHDLNLELGGFEVFHLHAEMIVLFVNLQYVTHLSFVSSF